MTLDEAIKHAEEVAEENEKFCYKKGGEFGYFNEDIDLNNTKCAAEHRQLAEWLKELQAHREAWGKAKRTVKAYLMLEGFGSAYQDDIEKLIDGCIPKESDAE